MSRAPSPAARAPQIDRLTAGAPLLDWALARRPARVASVLAGSIAGLALLGALYYAAGDAFSLFNPDGEGKPPAAFSAGVLLAAGGLAVLGAARAPRWPAAWRAIGAFLIYMGFDEGLLIHERLQSLTGVDWLTLYRPLVVVVAPVWLAVAWSLRRERLAAALWVGGACCWAVAQGFEMLAWDHSGGHVGPWQLLTTTEEALESAGSSLWLLAILIALRASARAGRRLSWPGSG